MVLRKVLLISSIDRTQLNNLDETLNNQNENFTVTLKNVNFWGDAIDFIQTLNRLKMCPITENDFDKDSILNNK